MADSFTWGFVALLAFVVALRLWLALRHIRHVRAHRDAVPPRFSDRITLAAHQKAADYTVDRTRLGIFALLTESLWTLALTLGGGLALLHALWAPQGAGLVYGIGLIISITLLSSLIDLPLVLYRQFVVEARHGFNRMTLRLFCSDLVKQALLGLLLGVPLLALVLWLIEAMGEHWWLYAWLVWSAFNLLMLFIYPTWIAPLFNRFSPLEDGELKTRIEQLLTRCGFASNGLFVMDGSRRSSHGNAYFTGFGRHKRIVFFDTLLARLTPPQIEAVLAHELGHFKRRHIVQRIVLLFTASLAGLWVLGQLMAQPAFYAGLGVPAQHPALALVLFSITLPLLTFFLSPLFSQLSRAHEFEADAYAAAHARAEDLIDALVRLYEDNAATLTPDPVHSRVYDSHPPAAERIRHLETLRVAG